jgi:hypothetical protein
MKILFIILSCLVLFSGCSSSIDSENNQLDSSDIRNLADNPCGEGKFQCVETCADGTVQRWCCADDETCIYDQSCKGGCELMVN